MDGVAYLMVCQKDLESQVDVLRYASCLTGRMLSQDPFVLGWLLFLSFLSHVKESKKLSLHKCACLESR